MIKKFLAAMILGILLCLISPQAEAADTYVATYNLRGVVTDIYYDPDYTEVIQEVGTKHIIVMCKFCQMNTRSKSVHRVKLCYMCKTNPYTITVYQALENYASSGRGFDNWERIGFVEDIHQMYEDIFLRVR